MLKILAKILVALFVLCIPGLIVSAVMMDESIIREEIKTADIMADILNISIISGYSKRNTRVYYANIDPCVVDERENRLLGIDGHPCYAVFSMRVDQRCNYWTRGNSCTGVAIPMEYWKIENVRTNIERTLGNLCSVISRLDVDYGRRETIEAFLRERGCQSDNDVAVLKVYVAVIEGDWKSIRARMESERKYRWDQVKIEELFYRTKLTGELKQLY